jgi:integrase
MYLLVKTGGMYWRLDYRFNQKRKTLAIGVYPTISLKRARELRDKAKEGLANGFDPLEVKKEDKQQYLIESENSFEHVARRWHEGRSEQWSEVHSRRILISFEKRTFPYIGKIAIGKVSPQDILKLLRKMENEGLGESTRRLKESIQRVFTFAIIEGLITQNPASNLEQVLKPKPKVEHQSYLKEDELPIFLKQLDDYDGHPVTLLALKMTMLTMVRTNELRNAKWSEIDWGKKEWHIPAERMKMNEAYIVPLSNQVLEILEEAKKYNRLNELIFEGITNARKPISQNTMIYAMYRLGYQSRATVHGFRSTASTILNEGGFRADVIERQLAHGDGNKIRAAYNHAQYMTERKEMLQWYADKIDSLRDEKNVIVGRIRSA